MCRTQKLEQSEVASAANWCIRSPNCCNPEALHAAVCRSPCCSLRWQDLLGINVTYTHATGQVEAFFSVAGCLTPNNASDRGCGPDGPSVAWIWSEDRQGLCPFFFGLVWSCRALVPWVWSLLQFRWRYTTSYYIFSFLFRSWHRYLLMLQQQNKKSKKKEGNWKKKQEKWWKVKLSLARKNESQQNESLFDGVLPFGPFCVSCTMTHMDSGGVSIPPWSA